MSSPGVGLNNDQVAMEWCGKRVFFWCRFTLKNRIFTKTGSGQAQEKLQKGTRFCRNHGITYQQNSTEGDLFIKLPNISFPFTDTGDLILAMGNQVHTDAGVSVPLEAALKTGAINTFWPPVFLS